MNITQLLKRKSVCEERIDRIDTEIWDRYKDFIGSGYGYLKGIRMEGDYVVITYGHRGDNVGQDLIHKSFFEIEEHSEAVSAFNRARKTDLPKKNFGHTYTTVQYDPILPPQIPPQRQ